MSCAGFHMYECFSYNVLQDLFHHSCHNLVFIVFTLPLIPSVFATVPIISLNVNGLCYDRLAIDLYGLLYCM